MTTANITAINKSLVINSCSKVLESSKFVNLSDNQNFNKVSESLKNSITNFDAFEQWKANELNPRCFDDYAINWIFLCDLLNFSFWKSEDGPNFDVEFQGKVYKNYWSLPATLNAHSPRICDPKFYSQISEEDFDQIFNPNIPLKNDRIALMHQAGKVLITKYAGSFVNYLNNSSEIDEDAWSFINRLIKEFPSFQDCSRSVWFLKRAQILVADLWAVSGGKMFSDSIDQLTIFADYRIPQVLSYLGLLSYSKDLSAKLQAKQMIPPEMEIEIRAASIIACEKLKEALGCCNSVELDFYLWEYSQRVKAEIDCTHPFHRTRSIYY